MTFILSIVWRGAALFAAVSFGFLLACIAMDRKSIFTAGPSEPDKTPGSVWAMESTRRAPEASSTVEFDPATRVSNSSVRAQVQAAMDPVENARGFIAGMQTSASPRSFGSPLFSGRVDSPAEMGKTKETTPADGSPRHAAVAVPPARTTGVNPIARTAAGSILATPRPAETIPTEEAAPIMAPEGDVALPVAFQSTSEDAKLTATQRKKLDDLQKRFVSDIEGGDQDPASPEYQSRWRKAQWTSDQQYRAMFGQQAFLQHQLATALADRRAGE